MRLHHLGRRDESDPQQPRDRFSGPHLAAHHTLFYAPQAHWRLRFWVHGRPVYDGPARQGCWYLLAPGTRHASLIPGRQRGRVFNRWFVLEPEDDEVLPVGELPLEIEDPGRALLAIHDNLHRHLRRGLDANEAVAGMILPWLLRELQLLEPVAGDADGLPRYRVSGSAIEPGDSLLARVDAAVQARIADPPSVAELAAELGMSASSLSHRFSQATGTTVIARIGWLRIEEAKRRIDRSGDIGGVARALGFTPSYFSRAFARHTGTTPRAYLAGRVF